MQYEQLEGTAAVYPRGDGSLDQGLSREKGVRGVCTEGCWGGVYLEGGMANLGSAALGQMTLTGLDWIGLDQMRLEKCSDKMRSQD